MKNYGKLLQKLNGHVLIEYMILNQKTQAY